MEHLLKGLIGPSASSYHQILVQRLIKKLSGLRSRAYLHIVLFLAASMLVPNSASALGVGVVESNSFIGERLEVRIPLFNVDNPDSLQIDFSSPQFDSSSQGQVNVSLDRSNSQLAVRLSSAQVMNEPYLNFTLGLTDAGTEFSKEFTVLLNLLPQTSALDNTSQNVAEASTGVARPLPQQNSYQVSGIDQVSGSNRAPAGSIMGPYDTAQAGQIPERFGAVLDGQSLWRVARRINSAMGASRSQMMWALFQANPDAFSGSTIETLKAGSYLTIPSAETVKQVSDQQAKNNIANLGSGSSSTASVVADSTPAAADEFELGDVDSSASKSSDVVAESPFQVTGIDQGVGQSDELSSGSEKIISSLTETVGNLSQQLERKDRRIDFLEQQVAELKQYIDDEPVVEKLTDEPSLADQDSDFGIGESLDQPAPQPNSVVETDTQNTTSNVQSTTLASKASSIPLWQWALLALFVLSLALYFARERIVSLGRSLNLFGTNDQVSFEHDVDVSEFSFDQASPEPARAVTESPAKLGEESSKDFSIMESVKHNMDNKEVLDGISYLDLADDGSYEENEVLELVTEEQYDEAPAEDLTFDERFEFLLKEKDFEFARELLDFARYNEIDDDRYHCERLRLLEKEKDEDGFYEYYYEIEAKIPTFPPALQTKISQLVVQLAHT